MKSAQDQDLISQLLSNHPRALYALYRQYQNPLLRFVKRQISDESIAEEIVQDIFIQFLDSLRDFRQQCSIKSFLFTLARNKTIDYIRKKKLKQIVFSHLPSFVLDQISKVFLDDDIDQKELEKKLENALRQLPHEYEMILRLKYIEDQPVDRIAVTMFKTFKSTESLLFRARKMFIKLYGQLP